MKYRAEIDGLRALAVLSVVIFHVNKPFLPGGFIGVDMFFVISGFLISSIIVRQIGDGTWSFKTFYVKRLRRLAPAMLTVCFLTVVLGLAILGPTQLVATSKSALSSVLYVSNIQFWLESGYFDSESIFKPLLHTWSLSVEEQFYLIWPVLIVLSLRFSSRVLAAVFILLFVASLWAAVFVESKHPAAAFFLMPFRVYEFSVGALLMMILLRVRISGLIADIFRVMGGALIIGSVLFLSGDMEYLQLWALPACVGTCLVILAGTAGTTHFIFTNKVVLFFGKISYSLYLVHWPLITLYFVSTFKPFSVVSQLGLILTSIVLGALLYKYVETPLRYSKPKIGESSKSASAVIGLWLAGSVGVILLTSYIWMSKGLPNRVDKSLNEIVETRHVGQQPCRGLIPAATPSAFDKACILGNNKSAHISMILLGDSHAFSLRLGFTDYLQSRGLKGIYAGRPGQLPILNMTTFRAGHPKIHERKISDEWIEHALEEKPDLAILAGRWMLPYYSKAAGLETVQRVTLAPSDGQELPLEESRQAYKNGIVNTLMRFKTAGIPVLIIGQVPPTGVDPVHCMTRPSFIFAEQLGDCAFLSVESQLARSKPIDAMFTVAIEEAAHGKYFNATEVFCENVRSCILFKDEQILYRDDDHLSPNGSKFLINKIELQLDQLLKVKKPTAVKK